MSTVGDNILDKALPKVSNKMLNTLHYITLPVMHIINSNCVIDTLGLLVIKV